MVGALSEYCLERNWVEQPWHRLKLRHHMRVDVGTSHEREVVEALQGDQLEDVVRGAELCRDEDTLAPDKRAQLISFIEAHRRAERLFAARVALEDNAHPHYTMTAAARAAQPAGDSAEAATDIVLCGHPFDLARLDDQAAKLEAELKRWQEAVQTSLRSFPRLLFLRTSQRLCFLTALEQLWRAVPTGAPSSSPAPAALVERVLPYAALCFPELTWQPSWDAKLWAALLQAAAKVGSAAVNAEALLALTGHLLDRLADSTSPATAWLVSAPPAVSFESRHMCVLQAKNASPVQRFALAIQPWLSRSNIALGQVLDCTASIPRLDDFESMLKCTIRFPHLTGFSILGVDRLPSSHRDALLSHTSAVFQCKTPVAPLRLIFLSAEKSEAFTSFLREVWPCGRQLRLG